MCRLLHPQGPVAPAPPAGADGHRRPPTEPEGYRSPLWWHPTLDRPDWRVRHSWLVPLSAPGSAPPGPAVQGTLQAVPGSLPTQPVACATRDSHAAEIDLSVHWPCAVAHRRAWPGVLLVRLASALAAQQEPADEPDAHDQPPSVTSRPPDPAPERFQIQELLPPRRPDQATCPATGRRRSVGRRPH